MNALPFFAKNEQRSTPQWPKDPYFWVYIFKHFWPDWPKIDIEIGRPISLRRFFGLGSLFSDLRLLSLRRGLVKMQRPLTQLVRTARFEDGCQTGSRRIENKKKAVNFTKGIEKRKQLLLYKNENNSTKTCTIRYLRTRLLYSHDPCWM